MDTDEYQAKLAALGVDRGKLASGFSDQEPGPPCSEPQREPPPAAGNPTVSGSPPPKVSQAVNKSVNKCRCGVTISQASRRCRTCVMEDRRAKQVEMSGREPLVTARPSPPPASAPPEEDAEEIVLWHLLTEEEIEKIALAVITGNGGMAHEDDLIAVVQEMTASRLGTMLGQLVILGNIKISCHSKEVLYHGPHYVGIDWDYVI